jgi:acetyl esterase/lipase
MKTCIVSFEIGEDLMTYTLIGFILALIAFGVFVRFYLSGENLSQWDSPPHPTDFAGPPSEGQEHVLAYLEENFTKPAKAGGELATLRAKRARFETFGSKRNDPCERRRVTYKSAGNETISGEWTTLEGTDASRRILYLHGGAFAVGSAVSHRAITYNLAKRTGCAVFAPDYRLIPENKRLDGIKDAQEAYKYIVANGPNGEEPAQKVAVAGDSAGGNLTLMVIRWATSHDNLRTPDAAIALSPTVDGTMQSPSIQRNFETDIMLKPLVAPLLKIPRFVLLIGSWVAARMRPSHPTLSPIMGNLAGLPPTLIQVSTCEVLYDDAVRYTNKAQAAGSLVSLQSWDHMCHVWPIFADMLPEAHHAFDEMASFLRDYDVALPKESVAA